MGAPSKALAYIELEDYLVLENGSLPADRQPGDDDGVDRGTAGH